MKALEIIKENVNKINCANENSYSIANVLLYIHFLYKNKLEILQFENYQKLEYNLFYGDINSEIEYRNKCLEFWNSLNIFRITAGSRFLNDCYIYNHYNWLLINNQFEAQDSPFYSTILILERGGYIWRYKGNYNVGEKTLQVPFYFEKNLLFEIPSFDTDFLSFIDSSKFISSIPKKEEVELLYSQWIDLKNK